MGINTQRANTLSKQIHADLGEIIGDAAGDYLDAVVEAAPKDTGTMAANFTIASGNRPLQQLEKGAAQARQRASKRKAKKYKIGKPLAIVNPTRYFPYQDDAYIQQAVDKAGA